MAGSEMWCFVYCEECSPGIEYYLLMFDLLSPQKFSVRLCFVVRLKHFDVRFYCLSLSPSLSLHAYQKFAPWSGSFVMGLVEGDGEERERRGKGGEGVGAGLGADDE